MENNFKFRFIYKTTNIKNNKFYIGVYETNNLNDGYLGSGRVLRNSVYYYGKENFKREILEYCNNRIDLYQRESELVTEDLIRDPKCMNLVIGGKSFEDAKMNGKKGNQRFIKLMKDDKWREIQCKKQSIGIKKEMERKGINGRWNGKRHSEESKRKIGETNSFKQKGCKNSQNGTYWITNGVTNKKINKDNNIPIGWKRGRIL
jgi:hypothetical protein